MLRTELIRPIGELLTQHAQRDPERIAFRDDHREVSYAALADRTARLAGAVQQLGLAAGDRGLIFMDNRIEVVESYLGLVRAGLVAVCANPGSAPAEFDYILGDSQARLIVTDLSHLGTVRELVASRRRDEQDPAAAPSILVVGDRADQPGAQAEELLWFEDLATDPTAPTARDDPDLDAVAFMLYTSGTTGRPKGVHLTQRGCLWIAAACWAPVLGLCADDYVLSALPLFHSYALVLSVLGIVAVGATERIMTRFSASEVLGFLEIEDVTFLPGVPTMFNYLVHASAGRTGAPKALRLCMSAGAIMSATLNESFERHFGVPLLDGYGITETSTMVTMNWPVGTRKMGSCGLPVPGLSVRLVDPSTGVDAPPGHEGELWVQGPNVAPGYHRLPEATADAFVNGWYRTGDLARRDEDGYLTISGRTKELIIRGGENIYPAEVEAALLTYDAIADAAVVSRSHEALGEVPVAFVIPTEDPLDVAAVLDHCRTELSAYKIPAELIVTDSIPRTGSGKILRFKLQERLTASDSSQERSR